MKLFLLITTAILCRMSQVQAAVDDCPYTGHLKTMGRACATYEGDGVCVPRCSFGTTDGGHNSYCDDMRCCIVDYRPITGMKCGGHGKKVCASFPYCKDGKKTEKPFCSGGTHCCGKLPAEGESCDRGQGRVGKCKSRGTGCRGKIAYTCESGFKCCMDDEAKIVYNYKGVFGVDFWAKNFPTCGGQRQSPINILSDGVVVESNDVVFVNYDKVPTADYEIVNNGHTVQASPGAMDGVGITIGNGVDYSFLQFHFHWGFKNDRGSEHLIDGVSFPLELHIVHVNGASTDPFADGEGLAVLGIFFEIGPENEQLQPVLDALNDIKFEDQTALIPKFPLQNLLPMDRSFYRYLGSLTTPPCSEAVVWTVFQQPLSISEAQMDEFRHLIDNFGEYMGDNFRPTLPLFGRSIGFRSQ